MQPQYHLLRSFITRNNIARSQRASQFLLCTIAETKIQGFSLFSESTILCFNSVSQFVSPSYSVYLFENLEECFLNVVELKPLVFQRRINDRFIVLENWQSTNLNEFCKKTQQLYLSKELCMDQSWMNTAFLGVQIKIIAGLIDQRNGQALLIGDLDFSLLFRVTLHSLKREMSSLPH